MWSACAALDGTVSDEHGGRVGNVTLRAFHQATNRNYPLGPYWNLGFRYDSPSMSKRAGLLLFLAFAVLFLALNQGAYRGYFQDDEIDNLSWTPYLSPLDFLKGAITPQFQPNNFRPAGHYYFHAVEELAGLDFPVYVGVLQALHLCNVWLLWMLARRLGAAPFAAAAACFFFGIHMALFDDFWKPMYVFDVLCAGFCLLSIWCYTRERWVLSFAAFWLAYKSKELAVMLPVVLAAYELWYGKRRWKPLVAFFAVSLSFGVQGMWNNPNKDNDYTFRFTAAALAKTSVYYAGRIFLLPYLGFVAPAFALLARHRRTWFGLVMMGLFFVPMLFLPGRIYSAYCYLPFTGLAIALTGVAEALSPAALAIFLALWLPMDIHELRVRQRETLARDSEVRTWMSAVRRFAATREPVDAFVFDGAPAGFQRWGIEGALKYFYERGNLIVQSRDEAAANPLPTRRVALLTWDAVRKRLEITVSGAKALQ
jgi:hypothetical protein